MAAIEQELLEQFNKLDRSQQQRVLAFVRELTRSEGESGRAFIERTSSIHFPKEDLEEIGRYIEEHEEQVDWDEWNKPTEFPA